MRDKPEYLNKEPRLVLVIMQLPRGGFAPLFGVIMEILTVHKTRMCKLMPATVEVCLCLPAVRIILSLYMYIRKINLAKEMLRTHRFVGFTENFHAAI